MLITWEFEPGFMLNKPREVQGLLSLIDHRNFSVLFDTCHAYMCAVLGSRQNPPKDTLPGGVADFARLLEGKIGYVHLIDSDGTLHDNWTSTHAPFGTGNIDFDEALRAILDSGYRGDWWTIDLCFWPDAWGLLEESRNFVEDILKKMI